MKKKPIIIAAIVAVFIPLILALGLMFNWWSLAVDPSLDQSLNQSLTWIQASVAWFTLLFIAIAASQIWLVGRQINLERERAEREAYRRLISPEMQSAKRFLYCKEIMEQMKILDAELLELDEKFPENDSRERTQHILDILDQTRNEFSNIAQNMSFPLVSDNKMSLDHIEALIDEYNYLAKLVEDGKLNKTFATELGVRNFKTIYERTLPLIKLRCKLSKEYASHFLKYCEQ